MFWKQKVTIILKIIKFWTFIEQPDELEVILARKTFWTWCYKKTCHIPWYVVTGGIYDEIEHHTNPSAAWDLLSFMIKPQRAGFLNNIIKRLDYLTLKDCNNLAEYITKFCALVIELRSFSLGFKVDDNFFIYMF